MSWNAKAGIISIKTVLIIQKPYKINYIKEKICNEKENNNPQFSNPCIRSMYYQRVIFFMNKKAITENVELQQNVICLKLQFEFIKEAKVSKNQNQIHLTNKVAKLFMEMALTS